MSATMQAVASQSESGFVVHIAWGVVSQYEAFIRSPAMTPHSVAFSIADARTIMRVLASATRMYALIEPPVPVLQRVVRLPTHERISLIGKSVSARL